MTEEEHVARALLLGAVYKSWLHCYVWDGKIPERWVDADTLEDLTHDEKFHRLHRSIAHN